MIGRICAGLRSLFSGLRRSSRLDAEMKEEFTLHIELRAADLARSGLNHMEALRQARREFGMMAHHAEDGRASRGLRHFDQFRVSLLDFKLGLRMLLRYPGLTLVAGFALAFAICIGSATFEFLNQIISPSLAFHEGDRIVAVRNWNAANNRADMHAAHDFEQWRKRLSKVQDLGAYQSLVRNLIINGEGTPLELAEISAVAFSVTRVAPLMGRTLVASDELPGAAPVVVIGHDIWTRLFNSDQSIVGRSVQLGRTLTTIVGVMPEGFAFPISHSLWAPLRLSATDVVPGGGPTLRVFGKLAPGIRIEDAQIELSGLGKRSSIDLPLTHEHLRPQVMPYTQSIVNLSATNSTLLMSSNLFLVLLVGLVCSNVALLMFARAATREGEIAVRAALGASRGRIVGQLFAEALVLGIVAALVGLAVTRYALQWGLGMIEAELLNDGGRLPFWVKGGLSPMTVVYATGLTLFGAVIAGIVPALKVTRGLGARLKLATAGAGGLRFGGMWTAVIVTQVAATVTFPALAFFVQRDAVEVETVPVGFAPNQFLSTRIEFDRESQVRLLEDSATNARADFQQRYQALRLRLLNEPSVSGVTFASRLPRMYHGWNQIEADGGAVAPRDVAMGHRVSRVAIAPDYFEVLGVPLVEGRAFNASDALSTARVAIVNRTFVNSVFGKRNPIGHRIRVVAADNDATTPVDSVWCEIVGVAQDMGMTSDYGQAGIYEPIGAAGLLPVEMIIHTRGDPKVQMPRIRSLASSVDANLRLHQLQRLDDVSDAEVQFLQFWFQVTAMVSAIALLLSLAAIYAVMSFAVSRRTREIGIRVALGSSVQAITLAVFRKPLTQIGIGIVCGAVLVTMFSTVATGHSPSLKQAAIILAYTVAMTLVCALACIVPTRRALSVQPTEALRSE